MKIERENINDDLERINVFLDENSEEMKTNVSEAMTKYLNHRNSKYSEEEIQIAISVIIRYLSFYDDEKGIDELIRVKRRFFEACIEPICDKYVKGRNTPSFSKEMCKLVLDRIISIVFCDKMKNTGIIFDFKRMITIFDSISLLFENPAAMYESIMEFKKLIDDNNTVKDTIEKFLDDLDKTFDNYPLKLRLKKVANVYGIDFDNVIKQSEEFTSSHLSEENCVCAVNELGGVLRFDFDDDKRRKEFENIVDKYLRYKEYLVKDHSEMYPSILGIMAILSEPSEQSRKIKRELFDVFCDKLEETGKMTSRDMCCRREFVEKIFNPKVVNAGVIDDADVCYAVLNTLFAGLHHGDKEVICDRIIFTLQNIETFISLTENENNNSVKMLRSNISFMSAFVPFSCNIHNIAKQFGINVDGANSVIAGIVSRDSDEHIKEFERCSTNEELQKLIDKYKENKMGNSSTAETIDSLSKMVDEFVGSVEKKTSTEEAKIIADKMNNVVDSMKQIDDTMNKLFSSRSKRNDTEMHEELGKNPQFQFSSDEYLSVQNFGGYLNKEYGFKKTKDFFNENVIGDIIQLDNLFDSKVAIERLQKTIDLINNYENLSPVKKNSLNKRFVATMHDSFGDVNFASFVAKLNSTVCDPNGNNDKELRDMFWESMKGYLDLYHSEEYKKTAEYSTKLLRLEYAIKYLVKVNDIDLFRQCYYYYPNDNSEETLEVIAKLTETILKFYTDHKNDKSGVVVKCGSGIYKYFRMIINAVGNNFIVRVMDKLHTYINNKGFTKADFEIVNDLIYGNISETKEENESEKEETVEEKIVEIKPAKKETKKRDKKSDK